ncbi:MAG: OmpA family protein [Candidatus Schekmanbacteria bacterium]|nr:OmpA family protein [Candidatus Schekmanbacteria bacterium]
MTHFCAFSRCQAARRLTLGVAAIGAALTTLACAPKVLPTHAMVAASPGPADVVFNGKVVGQTPQTVGMQSLQEVVRLSARQGEEAPVETRIRFTSADTAEVTFVFGAGASAIAKALGLPRVLVFDYGAQTTFAVGKHEIKPEFTSSLDRQVQMLSSYFPGIDIYVCGHTDSSGDPQKNLALSLDRARAVADYLVAGKVPQEHVKTQGFGADYPLASNESEEGRAQNRRTEIVLPQ